MYFKNYITLKIKQKKKRMKKKINLLENFLNLKKLKHTR